MNEAETRADHIDPALKAAGWGVVVGSRIRREHPITPGRIEGRDQGQVRRGKPLTADYVLEYRNTKLAVIEAKAWNEALTEGVAQAKNYAGKMAIRYAYSSNGQGVYVIDMETGKEGETLAYPTPEELWKMTFAEANAWRDRFAAIPNPDKSGTWTIRFYQEISVNRVLEAIAGGRDRVLLTLATGTGKTSIAFQIAWKLFNARWNLTDWKGGVEPTRRPRVLFLADRNNLADQAYNDFTSFTAFPEDAMARIKPEEIRKKGKVPKNASIFFTIFQTFMSGPAMSGSAGDEGNWRGIMDYFAPAVQLGLTATPKRKDNADTYAYFGEPVYIYSLKEGVNDGFLTPFRVKQISTTLDEYVYTPDDKVVEGEVESGRRYTETDFNKIIEIKEREAHRVKLFMEQIDQKEKALVFCATQDHALAVRDLINQMKTSTDPNYCQRVTANDGELGNQHLRDFQDNEKTIPTILTTSQKLSTGVDARNIRNIVLMRPINSMIEFKQIIGRGTRLYDGKDYFTIYDFVKAYLHFSDPEWDGEPLEPEPCQKCGYHPCQCVKASPQPCPVCGRLPCECAEKPCEVCGQHPCACTKKTKAKVKLADGKERAIQHMVCTTFWHTDGTPISAQQFMEMLFGKLPAFFKDEAELRALWSTPDTRKLLLIGLGGRALAANNSSRCRKSSTPRRAIFLTCSHMLPMLHRRSRARNALVGRDWRLQRISTASSRPSWSSCFLTTSASASRNWIRKSSRLCYG